MEFIIYSKEYRNYYARFTAYVQAVGYSEASCKTFDTSIREFLCWLEMKSLAVTKVTESDIETYYDYQHERPAENGGTLSESRIGLNMYTIKLFFSNLENCELIFSNPVGMWECSPYHKRTRENLLSLEDIEKLYNECESAKQRAMLGIIYGCGLRRQEAVKLDANDVHFKSAMLYVRQGKGGRKRTIPIGKRVLTDLKDYYYNERPHLVNYSSSDPDAFLLNYYGKRFSANLYWTQIKKLIRKAKLDPRISLHHFRHAIATHLLESGMKLDHVKDFLGHMSIETTQTYTHITTTQMKQTTSYGTGAISM